MYELPPTEHTTSKIKEMLPPSFYLTEHGNTIDIFVESLEAW